MINSSVRAVARLTGYFLLTLPLMPVQALFLLVSPALARWLPHAYHRLACKILGLEVEVRGVISPVRPTLFICNHVSYLDIEVISAAVPTSFVAKREVANWPVFGWLARLQRTVFVERRATTVATERDSLGQRLEEGDNLVLFAEGTSSDGNRLKPFKSALFSAADRTVHGKPLTIQPVSLAYTRLDGLPIGRQWRPFFAWYGDMALGPHLWAAIGIGKVTATLEFHPPVTYAQFGSRKALAKHCEETIARGLQAANSGRQREVSEAAPVAAALP
jgi:1-acyl-sn-glycerol-3-phosphate acyltransferase